MGHPSAPEPCSTKSFEGSSPDGVEEAFLTLYAHLSTLDVRPGQTVERGETMGRSGTSGLAGGDHLHFAFLVGGTYVDPLEWWDGRWIQSHVEVRFPSSAH